MLLGENLWEKLLCCYVGIYEKSCYVVRWEFMGKVAMLLVENLPFFVPVSGSMAHATSAGNCTQ
jgi:hypothetical protein